MNIGNSLKKAAIWTLPAAAIGAGAALLLAPQSGRRTRRQTKLLAARCWGSVTDNVEKAEELFASGSHAAGKTVRGVGRIISKIA